MIDSEIILLSSGIQTRQDLYFDNIGLSNTKFPNSLSFLDDLKYLQQIINNSNIKGLLVKKNFTSASIPNEKTTLIYCDDPRLSFFQIYNYVTKKEYKKEPSIIDKSSLISDSTTISPFNVKIGRNCVIEPRVVINSNVIIGENTIIRSGSVLGSEGFEYKRYDSGILRIFHNKYLVIGSDVEIGYNCILDKGIYDRDTIIGNNTKIDSHVHIGHCSLIGNNVLIASGVLTCGTSKIDDNSWIGPRVVINSGINVGKNCFVGIGSVVITNVNDGEKVYGNPASLNYIKYLKNVIK